MKNFRLSDMHDLCRQEAIHIEATQAALVFTGLRREPDAAELQRRDMFEALCGLCDRAKDPAIVSRLRALAAQSTAARTAGKRDEDEIDDAEGEP